MHKRLNNVPGRPVISNCERPTERASVSLNFHLERVMKNGGSYIKGSNDFINEVKNIHIPNHALLVTADVPWLYPSVPHEVS